MLCSVGEQAGHSVTDSSILAVGSFCKGRASVFVLGNGNQGNFFYRADLMNSSVCVHPGFLEKANRVGDGRKCLSAQVVFFVEV